MSARSQDTLWDQDGGEAEEVTDDHWGLPERLFAFKLASRYAIDSFKI